MKKSGKRLPSLRTQLLIIICSFLICSLGVSLGSAVSTIRLQQKNLKNYLSLYASQLMATTSRSYTTFENIAYSTAYSSMVQNYVQITDPGEKYEAYQSVFNFLNNTAKLSTFIQDIAVLSSAPGGSSISLTASPSSYEKYQEETSESGYSLLSLGTEEIGGISCQILAMPVWQLNLSGSSRRLGTAYLAVNTGRFFSFSLSSAASGDDSITPVVVFLDGQGTVIYGDSTLLAGLDGLPEQSAGNVRIDGVNYVAEAFTLSSGNGTLYVLFESDAYLHSFFASAAGQAALLLSIFILLFVIALYRWMHLSRALQHLTQVMNEISGGERRPMHVPVRPSDGDYGSSEIRDIYHAYNSMMEEINRLNVTIYSNYTRMYEMEMNNRQTEIAFLRSQINPHFLNNTLTTINGMAASGQDEEIQEVTVALSRILQYSIRGSEMVDLAAEMDIVRDYLRIQLYRFEDRFGVQIDVEEAALHWRIPKMIIQPIVENAIVHGLEPSMRHGKLMLSARVDAERNLLVISIMDTGVGMSPEKLRILQESLARSTGRTGEDWKRYNAAHHDSIGLYNVNSRIILYYGKEYAMKIRSWEGAGTNIELTIPEKVQAAEAASGLPGGKENGQSDPDSDH